MPRAQQKITVYAKATCLTCQQAIDYLKNAGVEYEVKDIMADVPKDLLQAGIDPNKMWLFLNQHAPVYRKFNMRTKIPSKSEAIKLMLKDPNLIKRPIIQKGEYVLFGFDASELKKLVSVRVKG